MPVEWVIGKLGEIESVLKIDLTFETKFFKKQDWCLFWAENGKNQMGGIFNSKIYSLLLFSYSADYGNESFWEDEVEKAKAIITESLGEEEYDTTLCLPCFNPYRGAIIGRSWDDPRTGLEEIISQTNSELAKKVLNLFDLPR